MCMNLFLVIEAILPVWLIWVLGGSLISVLLCLLVSLDSSPSEKTRRIAILGSTASGKTTLWNQLRGQRVLHEYIASQQEKVDSFSVRSGDHFVRILATKDIGGADLHVKAYEDVINDHGTFVYFLIDLMTLEETKQEIRSRLQFISQIIKNKKLENCGFKILATHFDIYQKQFWRTPDSAESSAKANILNCLTGKKIKNCSLNIDLDHIMVVNLLDNTYIEKIKKEITLEG